MTDTASRHPKWEKFAQILTVLLAPLALLTIMLLTVLSWWPGGSSRMDLEIIAHREDAPPDFWTVNGRVRRDGNDVPGARVWVILKGEQGDRDSPPVVITRSDGQFTLTNLPKTLRGKDVRVAEIHARLTKDGRELKGVEILRSGDAPALGTTGPPAVIGSLAALLLLSMLLPFLGATPARTRYVLSMVLAVLFNFSVIGGVGYGMYKVHSAGSEGRVPPLGFISVFRGTYVERGPEQWLISLSDQGRAVARANPVTAAPASGSATPAGSPPATPAGTPEVSTREQGFGAPLWVLMLAVVGSGILTVSLITREIREPPEDNPEKIREKIYNAVQHQVYVLFSPIGAIFVYQTMVVTNTAGHPLIVALAALGAGAALNALLKYAVESATALFTRTVPPPPPPPHTKAAAGGAA